MVILADPLQNRLCPKCRTWAGEVIHAEKKIRRGWLCANCGHFETAINRERKLENE